METGVKAEVREFRSKDFIPIWTSISAYSDVFSSGNYKIKLTEYWGRNDIIPVFSYGFNAEILYSPIVVARASIWSPNQGSDFASSTSSTRPQELSFYPQELLNQLWPHFKAFNQVMLRSTIASAALWWENERKLKTKFSNKFINEIGIFKIKLKLSI